MGAYRIYDPAWLQIGLRHPPVEQIRHSPISHGRHRDRPPARHTALRSGAEIRPTQAKAKRRAVVIIRDYRRLNAFPQLPQRIKPGLYPPITNLVRQCGQVTV